MVALKQLGSSVDTSMAWAAMAPGPARTAAGGPASALRPSASLEPGERSTLEEPVVRGDRRAKFPCVILYAHACMCMHTSLRQRVVQAHLSIRACADMSATYT